MVKLTTVRLNPLRLTFRTWLAKSCMDSLSVKKEPFSVSKITSLKKMDINDIEWTKMDKKEEQIKKDKIKKSGQKWTQFKSWTSLKKWT